MERIEVPILGRRPIFQTGIADSSNFAQLASDASWRTTWKEIVAGKFTSSPYSALLFVEESTGYAELYETDGLGHIQAPSLHQYNPLGDRTTWTNIVPGLFGPSGFDGLLLYDRAAGFGRFYGSDGRGAFVLKSEYSGWRTSWTHVVAGRFVASSPYSAVFFYDAAADYGEIWATDGTGLAGQAPYQTFSASDLGRDADSLLSAPGGSISTSAGSTFTHVIAGDFHWTPGYITQVKTLTDLFFYDAVTGSGVMYRCTASPPPNVFVTVAGSDGLPINATSVIAGNFGGVGNTDLAFYSRLSDAISFYSFVDTSDTSADLVLHETQAGLRPTVDLVVAGNFRMVNPDDHWFNDGPVVSLPPFFDPDWRFGTGAFSDLLFYDRNTGIGEFYAHENLPYAAAPLEGYITSQTSHGSSQPVSTGSILPGESISFHVNSQFGPYSISVYLQGLFTGAPEQFMAEITGLPNDPVPLPISPTGYKDGAGWPSVATFVIPASWPAGLYLARIQTTGASSYTADVPFVVRAPQGCETGVLLVLADTTHGAYNEWGGRNSYGYISGSDFAGAYPSTSALRIPFGFQLSFERPFGSVIHGFGNIVQTWELPFIQWLASKGVPVDVCTSRDLHFEAPNPSAYRLLLFAGHHEYWTAEMRTNVEAFARSGGNVAFFAGNVCWWQIRLSTDGGQLFCYKIAAFDPVSTTDHHALTTVHWFDALVNRPETALTGVSWLDGAMIYDQNHVFTVKNANSWVFTGTGLTNGGTFGRYSSLNNGQIDSSVCGSETDRVETNNPNGLNSPPNYTLASIFDPSDNTLEVGTMGVFSPAGGTGVVFNAATINWVLGLSHDPQVEQITLNILTRLGPPRPTPWTSVSEGQSRPGAPITAVVTGQNQITLLLADPEGGVYTASGSAASGWSPWSSVSEGQSTPGAPITAVVTGQNQISLFLADPGGGVYTASGNASNGWSPWSSVSEGQSTPGAPITAVVTGQNQITLFLADPGGGVYTVSGSAANGWSPWSSVSEGQSAPGARVSAVVAGDNRIRLFSTDPAGGIKTTLG
jgi:hypothetical protein